MHRKYSLTHWAGAALALLFLAHTSARADQIQWSYNWDPSGMKVYANAGGSGYLALTDAPTNSAGGSSNTLVTNIHAVSTAPYNTPDNFNKAAVSFTLQLTDKASGATGSVTFSGYFSGTITGHSAEVALTITSPMTQAVTLGGNTYSVALGTYTPPGPPDASNVGALNAFVSVTSGGGGGVVSGGSAPEPSSLILASLALPCVGLSRWRKRRTKKDHSVVA